jgi:hypothetical protein
MIVLDEILGRKQSNEWVKESEILKGNRERHTVEREDQRVEVWKEVQSKL